VTGPVGAIFPGWVEGAAGTLAAGGAVGGAVAVGAVATGGADATGAVAPGGVAAPGGAAAGAEKPIPASRPIPVAAARAIERRPTRIRMLFRFIRGASYRSAETQPNVDMGHASARRGPDRSNPRNALLKAGLIGGRQTNRSMLRNH